ncbi:MAG: 2Fe-2S iron-sulfur cluster-binding protein [Bacteroidota bacterium]
MPTVTIDGQEFEFEKGAKALQFLLDEGIEIPHFCYHPALSVPANCRQCLVRAGTPMFDRATREPVLDDNGVQKINFFPKLMPSCSLDLSDGMVIETQYGNPDVEGAHEDNLELLLINHPLDCPICDQAGHCPLQIQAYKYGPEGSRFEFEKVHKPKRIDLGPHVILDAERCINCTRCTRFTSEVSGSHQLSIVNRGDKNYPLPPPGEPFDDPYSMNVADICPVGALTEKYFRFKARVWEMSSTPSVSDFGSKGLNVTYWVKDNQVLRITPRANADVNEFWLPDAARLLHSTYNENRPAGPTVTFRDGGRGGVKWAQAVQGAAMLLKDAAPDRIVLLGSARASVEDNHLLAKLANGLGAATPQYLRHVTPGTGDGWLVTDDQAPNTQGVERLGFAPVDETMLRAKLDAGEIDLLYVLDDDPVAAGLVTADDLAGIKVILHHTHATNETLPHADVAFPAPVAPEQMATYVNEVGRAQLLRPAKMTKTFDRALLMRLGTGQSRLDRGGTPFDNWVDEKNMVDAKALWEIAPDLAAALNLTGFPAADSAAVMADLAASNPAFAGATHAAMDLQGAPLADVGEPA